MPAIILDWSSLLCRAHKSKANEFIAMATVNPCPVLAELRKWRQACSAVEWWMTDYWGK
jgi:hypothetical protein